MMEPARLRRHEGRANYEWDKIQDLFRGTFLAHVSYVDDGLPICLPMIALPLTVEDQPAIYLHGHPSSRLMEIVRGAGESPAEMERVRVCITATKVDGLVLSSAPNGHTFNYRSGVVHGSCSLVKNLSLKRTIMREVTNHIVSNRWEDVNPVASFQVSLVCIIKVDILRLSMKSRQGIPGIQPRNIEKDGPDRMEPVWTGVVPVHEVLEEPVPSGLTETARLPQSLSQFIEEKNRREKTYSLSVAR